MTTNEYRTTSHSSYRYWGGSGYWGGSYWGGGYSYSPYFYSGYSFGFGFHLGHFGHFGHFGYSWLALNYPGYYYYPQYFGMNSCGWGSYYWGGHCSYWPFHSWRHRHCFNYHGLYFLVGRPYWYGYSRWYDYSPYRYSYTTLVYDSLDEDDYNDGYDRGYEDGAEDASSYSDDRRRDSIGDKRDRSESDVDRADTEASEEFRYEMKRGTDAFAKGDYKAATKAFKEAAILSPGSADARYSLSVSAFAEGKYSFSAFALRRGVTLDASRSDIDLQAAFGDPVVFKGYVERLNGELADNPEDADLLLVSGFVALRSGNASEAAAKLDRAMQAAPDDASAKALHREAMDALENE